MNGYTCVALMCYMTATISVNGVYAHKFSFVKIQSGSSSALKTSMQVVSIFGWHKHTKGICIRPGYELLKVILQSFWFRPIRVDHTNCLQVAIKPHSFIVSRLNRWGALQQPSLHEAAMSIFECSWQALSMAAHRHLTIAMLGSASSFLVGK